MVATHQTDDSLVASLREHVLTPLSTAERTVETEYGEVDAERRAFIQFCERVAGIETMSMSQSAPASTLRTETVASRSRALERVRNAFRETVMSVDHYDEMYGEPLEEYAAAELSADVAAGLRSETASSFTELYKTALTTAVDGAIEQREMVCEHLDAELESLETCRTALVEILDTLDGPTDLVRHRSDFEERLDEIARSRQETIQRRHPLSRTDGHDLCQYLYQEPEWTYPVLTAVTRFRNSVA